MGKPFFSSQMSFRVSVVVEYTRFEIWGLKEPLGGGTVGASSGAVMRKSVSSSFT